MSFNFQPKELLNIIFCTYHYLDRKNGTVDFGNCADVGCVDMECDAVGNRMVADRKIHILARIDFEVQMVENGLVHYVQISYYDVHDLYDILHAYFVTIV